MKVKKLIQLLQTANPNSNVYVGGYGNGFLPVDEANTLSELVEEDDDKWFAIDEDKNDFYIVFDD